MEIDPPLRASSAGPGTAPATEGLGLPRDWSPEHGLDERQAESLRKMLLALAADPKLMLSRLEQQLASLQAARNQPGPERERLALETQAVFAPLANRLGAGELKWQLEDFAFRYLSPDDYHRIAAALQEKRVDREAYVDSVCASLRAELQRAGVRAEVRGRAKHIYSIYRKMQRKQLSFEKVFDVFAVRVLTDTVEDCYAALSVVHGLWPYIAGEFDDYIATPKANNYRSIHTAVTGPQGKSVEVQIRTREMHEQAELGGATHWIYKEGGTRDTGYARRIEWARRLLSPAGADDPAERDFLERIRGELFADRIYALTPKGKVIELTRGATSLDFAYQVHTDIGHRCRGAKINGRIVPLTNALANGDVVEIITGREPAPSRNWLVAREGYLASARNRAKVKAWFKKQEEDAAHARAAAPLAAPAAERVPASPAHSRATPRPPARRSRSRSPVEVEGVGDLPTTLARCCRPIPPQPITGYVTLSRGVTVHRSDCRGLARMQARNPERVLRVSWTSGDSTLLSVAISAVARDRPGLVRDLADVVAAGHLNIEAMTTTTDRQAGTAHVVLKLELHNVGQLAQLLESLARVSGVEQVWRSA
jgi:GTP pyrophosphokinase